MSQTIPFAVIANVEMPKKTRLTGNGAPRARKYPLDKMDVGTMFFVPQDEEGKLPVRLPTYLSAAGKTLSRKFATRRLHMAREDETQPWVPAPETDPNATYGVGVWRTA